MLVDLMQHAESGIWTAEFWSRKYSGVALWLLCVGFLGQAMFFSRFLVQWVVSERARKSVFPMAFWYLSLTGGMILFFYAWQREDPVIMLGQAVGTLVYVRNITLRQREARAASSEE